MWKVGKAMLGFVKEDVADIVLLCQNIFRS